MTGTTFDGALIIASDWNQSHKPDQNLLKDFLSKDSKPYDAVLIKPLSGFTLPKTQLESPRSESSQSETRLIRSQSNASTYKTSTTSSSDADLNFIEISNSSPNLLNFTGSFVPSRHNWIYSQESLKSQKIYKNVLNSTKPIDIDEKEEFFYQGQKSLIANKPDFLNWKGPIPLKEYPINEDESPEIIVKKSEQKIEYDQEITIRYLQPPTPPPHGDIIIQHEKDFIPPPAPPLVIRQQPTRPKTPPPLVIREAPPKPIQKLESKVITIPGKKLPPPPRKVIIERLPQLPNKPQPVVVERWLPYKSPKRRVIYKKPEETQSIEKPKNVIIQWETPSVVINRKFKDLGVVRANPEEYILKYGSEFQSQIDLPEFVKSLRPPDGLILASESQGEPKFELEGDLEALSLIDIDIDGEFSQTRSSSRLIEKIIDKYMKKLRTETEKDVSSFVGEVIEMVKAKTSDTINFNEAFIIVKTINEKLNVISSDIEIETYLKSIKLDKYSMLELGTFKRNIISKYEK